MRSHTARLKSLLKIVTILISASGCLLSMPAAAQNQYATNSGYGNYYRPFAANSPWNIRPVNPVLDTYQIKKPLFNPGWIPAVDDGEFSLGVFMAKKGDPTVTVYGKPGTAGVTDPDTGKLRNIVIPRWPANVVPAAGGDGHADIVDTESGILHSFYQLKFTGGKWTARMYSWSRIDGRGWGNASHWSQGSRAAGVPASGGLIRLHELDDGLTYYRHALSMSLPAHTLANGITHPAYVYPATSTDSYAISNTGAMPMGARLMLPASFNVAALSSERLRKIANTLKMYGAFVVDSNYDTAYRIYVENGNNFSLMPGGWDAKIVADLELIRAGLRRVTGAQSWIDGNGKTTVDAEPPGTLSMRGVWKTVQTLKEAPGQFDSWQQAVSFPYTTNKVSQINYANALSQVAWAKAKAGQRMRFTSEATGGATMRLQLVVSGKITFDSGYLRHGQFVNFSWPNATPDKVAVTLLSDSGVYTTSTARGVLTED